MCYGKCARCIGHSLVGLALLCIIANILLYFPNGETKYASENHLSRFVWFFSGIVGGGLLMLLPAFVFIGLEQDDCCGCCGHENCGKRCALLSLELQDLATVSLWQPSAWQKDHYVLIPSASGTTPLPAPRASTFWIPPHGPSALNPSTLWSGMYLCFLSSWLLVELNSSCVLFK